MIALTEFIDICKSYGLVETRWFEWCRGMTFPAEPNVSYVKYYDCYNSLFYIKSSEPTIEICYPLFIDKDTLEIRSSRTIKVHTADELKKMIGCLAGDYKKLRKQIRMQFVDNL